tara:strand:+ start:1623 stop:2321 length:699 start_codon:yes stop_codon:yes gene_type:complete
VETTTINARIKQIISLKQLTISSFSRKIGLVNGVTISKIINQNRKPSSKTIGRIINAFSEINYDWLVNGEGEMLKSSKEASVNVNEDDLTVTSKQLINFIRTDVIDFVNKQIGKNQVDFLNQIEKVGEKMNNKFLPNIQNIQTELISTAEYYLENKFGKVFDDMDTIKEKAKIENAKFFKSHERTLEVVKALEEETLQMNKKIAKLDILIETIEKHNLIEKEKISSFIKNTK